AIVNSTTKLAGSCGGCHIGCKLLQRLPHRLKADTKAAIEVVGFYKGCHIAEKVATLLKWLYRGYGLDILLKTNPNRGSYEGENISWLKLASYLGDGFPIYRSCLTNSVLPTFISRGASTLRLRGWDFYGAFDRAFDGAFEGPSTGPSRRRPRIFFELNKGRKRWLHPLREYIITLYTNGKLCIRVTVMLVSRAEGTSGLRAFDAIWSIVLVRFFSNEPKSHESHIEDVLHPRSGFGPGSIVQHDTFVVKSNNFKGNDFKNGTNIVNMGPNPNMFLAVGWHLEEIHVTWAHLEKKRMRLRTYTKSMKKYCSQSVEMASQA
ncbi:hypothetical protein Tco_0929617, partial [Tanacetum coccineum]